jgi:hypothetical protein
VLPLAFFPHIPAAALHKPSIMLLVLLLVVVLLLLPAVV